MNTLIDLTPALVVGASLVWWEIVLARHALAEKINRGRRDTFNVWRVLQ